MQRKGQAMDRRTTPWPLGSSAMAERIRAFDWPATPLGPVAGWPAMLRDTVQLALHHAMPMAVLWGEQRIQLYNDACIPILGNRHPDSLGRPAFTNWPEAAGPAEPLLARTFAGETVTLADAPLRLDRDGRDAEAWFSITTSPLIDGDAGPRAAGILVTAFETTATVVADRERAAAFAVLRKREAQQRVILEVLPVGVAVVRPDGELEQCNAAMRHFLPTETMPSRDPDRQDRWQGWDAEGRPIDVRDFPGARALRGESVLPGTEMLYTEDDGRRVWVRVATVPLMDAERRPQGQITVVHDVDAMKRGAEALRASESRFRSLVEGIPQLVWRAREGGLWTWASPQWTEFTGQSCADSLDMGWLDAVHPEDRDDARALWGKAAASGSLAMAGRLRHAASGEYRWFQTRATPVRDADGTIIEWLGTSTDVHELRALKDRQQILVAELQHRTRNLMGVVRSMTQKTMETSVDLDDFRARLWHRLDALARAQQLLSRLDDYDRVTFDELIRTEIAAMDGGPERVTLDGPMDVRLRSSSVQTLAMALHELATNAVKYGALGQAQATLAIRWWVERAADEDRPMLWVDWRECNVRHEGAQQGDRWGHGRELIERALPYQLDARTSFALTPDGVHCTIAVPVSHTTAAFMDMPGKDHRSVRSASRGG